MWAGSDREGIIDVGIMIDDDLFFLLVDDLSQFFLVSVLIFIAPSPGVRLVSSVTGSLDALLNDFFGDGLKVVRPSYFGEEIDKGCRKVHSVVSELSGFVVPWEDMLE